MTARMKIWGVPLSVHTRKVILASRIKSIPYDITPVVPVIPDNPPVNWRSVSPSGLIPAIDDGGYVLADSTAIVHYLERKVPEPALLPRKLEDYGRALFLDGWAGDVLFRQVVRPIFYNQVVSPRIHDTPGDPRAIAAALGTAAPEAFAYLESLGPRTFLVGDQLTIADLAVVSNLVMFHYLGHRLDAAKSPGLAAYFRRQIDAPVFRGAVEAEAAFGQNLGLDRSFLA
jgi:glutathione S-transferase